MHIMTANKDVPDRPPAEPRLRLRYRPGPDDKQFDLTIEADPPDELNWKQYETYVFNLLRANFPGADIQKDVRLPGMRSNTQRQIDILVKQQVTGLNITIAFDCKNYNRKLNVRHVETFLSTLEDIGVSKGVIITGRGYSKAARDRARQGGRDIEVRVIEFQHLSDYHSVGSAIAWSGQVAMFVSAPSEWVIDNEPVDTLFAMYPLGYTRESAIRHGAFIYGNVVRKDDTLPTLEAIVELHNRNIEANAADHGSTARIEFLETISRKDERVLLRRAEIHKGYKGPEYTLYVERPQGVLLLVLLARAEEEQELRRNLEWVGQKCELFNTDQLPPHLTTLKDSRPPSRLRLRLTRVEARVRRRGPSSGRRQAHGPSRRRS